VLRIGVGGCSILGGGHRPCAVLVCCRWLFSGGADRGVSGHICVAGCIIYESPIAYNL
jgi:hypothetical protein